MKFSEQLGYKLYDRTGKEVPSPKTTIQGLIVFASKIYGKALYAKIVDQNEAVLYDSLLYVAKNEIDKENIVFFVRGIHKSCCG